PRRRRRAAEPQAAPGARPRDRRHRGGSGCGRQWLRARRPGGRALAWLDVRRVPLLPHGAREPVRAGALHGLPDRRRVRRVHGGRRALLPCTAQGLRRRRGGTAPLCRVDRLPRARGRGGRGAVGALVPAALRAVEKGGTVVGAGIHMSDIPTFPYDILWGERVVRSVANLTRRDGEKFLRLAPAVPVRTTAEPFRLDRANDALERLRSGRLRGAAVLLPGATA